MEWTLVTYQAYKILCKSVKWFTNLKEVRHKKGGHLRSFSCLWVFIENTLKIATIEYQPMFSPKHSSFIALRHILWNSRHSRHTDISDKMCMCSHTWTTTTTTTSYEKTSSIMDITMNNFGHKAISALVALQGHNESCGSMNAKLYLYVLDEETARLHIQV